MGEVACSGIYRSDIRDFRWCRSTEHEASHDVRSQS